MGQADIGHTPRKPNLVTSFASVCDRSDRPPLLVMNAFWNYRPYNRATSIEMGRLETTYPISPTTHLHLEVQVAAVAHGWRVYSTPLGDFCASPGDMIIIPAHLPHASRGSAASIVTHLWVPSDHPSTHGIVVPQIIRGVRARSPGDVLDRSAFTTA
jgi:hypothetical protein